MGAGLILMPRVEVADWDEGWVESVTLMVADDVPDRGLGWGTRNRAGCTIDRQAARKAGGAVNVGCTAARRCHCTAICGPHGSAGERRRGDCETGGLVRVRAAAARACAACTVAACAATSEKCCRPHDQTPSHFSHGLARLDAKPECVASEGCIDMGLYAKVVVTS